ncbi:hypothetical protein ES705_06031 [subsurface metagenome]
MNHIRRKKVFEARWFLYEFINKNPELSIYDLSKKLNWHLGKVDYHVKKLIKGGIVRKSEEFINGRIETLYYPIPFKDLINWDEMTEIKKHI